MYENPENLILAAMAVIFALILLIKSFTTVQQGTCAVVTMFGKHRRIMQAGLNVKIPFLERVAVRVPVQNQAQELQFQATTRDQAQVNFTAMVLFSVKDSSEETIKKVAFKFVNYASFQTALVRSIESAIRSLVATKAQAEILGLRSEIVSHVKDELDTQLEEWGYHLLDLQINDISFGVAIMQSMERVVAAQNERVAAENEGAALLIRETKKAEAEGAAIRIAAENEATAARLRGEGLAMFRKALAEGFGESAELLEKHGLDPALLAFSMWTETIRDAAKEGAGNTIFIDGNIATGDDAMRRLQAMTVSQKPGGVKKKSSTN